MTTRRRFLVISAAALAFPGASQAHPVYTWRGVALGANATLRLAHPEASAIAERVANEISRLENIFSLFQPDSSLMHLNRAGALMHPPFELLECLSIANRVHTATHGAFDPTIQTLWACYAEASALGMLPDKESLSRATALTGWDRVSFDAASVVMDAGMALTLNGIAQGYIADRVASMLGAEGLSNVLIDTGELRAIGSHPQGAPWPVKLSSGGAVSLCARSLATSAPLGTTFDEAGLTGHILDPKTGLASRNIWQEISISAASAALADALSTAACLSKTRTQIEACLSGFNDAILEAAIPA